MFQKYGKLQDFGGKLWKNGRKKKTESSARGRMVGIGEKGR